jgi:hypothetical protein
MYDCVCGFSAQTATAFHAHLSSAAASDDPVAAHRLTMRGGNNRYGGGGGGGNSVNGPRPADQAQLSSSMNAGAKANRPRPAGGGLDTAAGAAARGPSFAGARQAQQQQWEWRSSSGGAAPVAATAGRGGSDSGSGSFTSACSGRAPQGLPDSLLGAAAAAPLPLSTPATDGDCAVPRSGADYLHSPLAAAVTEGFKAWQAGGGAGKAAAAAMTAAAAAAVADAFGGSGDGGSGGLIPSGRYPALSGGGGSGGAESDGPCSPPPPALPPLPPLGAASPSPPGSVAASLRQTWSRIRASTAALAASGEACAGAGAEPAGPRAEAVRALLLWREPGASARALGVGLYLILLVGSLPRGLEYLQVTSVLPGALLLLMAWNFVKAPMASGYSKVAGGTPADAAAALAAAEARAAARAADAAASAARSAAAWAGGAAALAARSVRGRSPTATVCAFGFLWTLLLVSELRLVPQTALAMIAYGATFALPWACAQFKAPLDAAVAEGVNLLWLLVAGCERASLALAAAAAAGAWHVAEAGGASLVVRASGGAAAALGVLLWRAAAGA